MPLPLTPILIAGATAAIGWFFQENSAKNARRRQNDDAERERKRQLREAELSRAQEILKELSLGMDVMYYLLSNDAIFVAVRKATDNNIREKEDGETWDKIEIAVMNWMSGKTRFAARVQQYFGKERRTHLDNIHDTFNEAWSCAQSTYYGWGEPIVDKGKAIRSKYFGKLGRTELECEIIALNERMIRDIQNQKVGILRTK